MPRPNTELPVLDFLADACNNYCRHCYPTLEFKSHQHRDIVKLWFAAAFEAYTHAGDESRASLVLGALAMMRNYNWWPDERFNFKA